VEAIIQSMKAENPIDALWEQVRLLRIRGHGPQNRWIVAPGPGLPRAKRRHSAGSVHHAHTAALLRRFAKCKYFTVIDYVSGLEHHDEPR
jgi:hypothetical protein